MMTYTATKAKVGAAVAAVAGFVLPGVTYLLTVDANGISGTEWLHAALLAAAGAGAAGAGVGASVYWAENKPHA